MDPTCYRITVRGRLPNAVGPSLQGLRVLDRPGATILLGELRDASHLYGVIHWLEDLGLELVGLEEVAP